MKIVPVSLKTAKDFVAQHHRHNKPPPGHKFSIGLEYNGRLIGVCMVGRPIARNSDDGSTLEVIRLATDGTKNACSKLYARAKQIVQLMGYTRLLTYTLTAESGSSLRAIGAQHAGTVPASRGWHSRQGRADLPTEQHAKNRWLLLEVQP